MSQMASLIQPPDPLSPIVSSSVPVDRHALSVRVMATLAGCRGCHNKARRDCPNGSCGSCCRATGQPCVHHMTHLPRSAALPVSSSSSALAASHALAGAAGEFQPAALLVNAEKRVGRAVVGKIDGEFTHGFTVSVAIDGFIYSGVLFSAPCEAEVRQMPEEIMNERKAEMEEEEEDEEDDEEGDPKQGDDEFDSNPSGRRRYIRSGFYSKRQQDAMKELGLELQPPKRVRTNRTRRPAKAKAPKKPRSAYVYFDSTRRARLRTCEPSKREEINRLFNWATISEAAKEPYKLLARVDKQRYEDEMKVYAEYLKNKEANNEGEQTNNDDEEEEDESEEEEQE